MRHVQGQAAVVTTFRDQTTFRDYVQGRHVQGHVQGQARSGTGRRVDANTGFDKKALCEMAVLATSV